MKQQTHLHPPKQKSPPFGMYELYSYPQTLHPSPCTHKKGHVFEDACSSAVATELQSGSESLDASVRANTLTHILTGAF